VATGFLTSISSSKTASSLRSLTYTWDKLGNLKSRADARLNIRDDFTYDPLNRLTQSKTTAGSTPQTTVTVAYDALGNITSKSDIGTYTYGSTDSCGGLAGPHAVRAVAGVKTASYCYDANGAMISGDGRTITWGAFGMPTRIVSGLRTIDIVYGPDRARFKRVDTNETGTSTTHYVAGGAYETVTSAGKTVLKLTVAGVAVVINTSTTPGVWTSEIQYLLTDHLGSVDVITNAAGAVVERLSFDAWGKRRTFDWKVYAAATPYPWQGKTITRGYTFHEQLDPVGLIHMNGRVYDPEIGRFLSADIAIQDLSNLQAHNVYTYVNNNPLSFTDPSGFFLSGLFKAIGNVFKSIFKFVGQVFKAILNSQIGRAILQIAACTFGPHACIAAAGTLTLAAGGAVRDAFISMATTFVSLGTWSMVGEALTPALSGLSVAGKVAAKGLVHGVVGGALSMSQGGSFLEGFAANAIGAGAGVLSDGTAIGSNIYVDTAFVALAGGLAAEITGGKFANGAITAAFANLYNKWGRQLAQGVGVVLGGIAGGALATGGTAACAAGTGGACGLGAPWIIGAGVAAGGASGNTIATTIYDAIAGTYANDNQASVHGNSSLNMDGTELYYLINRSSGAIDKIGVTSNPSTRYSQSYLATENVIYEPQAYYQSRYAAYLDEFVRLKTYRYENGSYPRLNRNGR